MLLSSPYGQNIPQTPITSTAITTSNVLGDFTIMHYTSMQNTKLTRKKWCEPHQQFCNITSSLLYSLVRNTVFRRIKALVQRQKTGPYPCLISEISPVKVKSGGSVYSSRRVYLAKYGKSFKPSRIRLPKFWTGFFIIQTRDTTSYIIPTKWIFKIWKFGKRSSNYTEDLVILHNCKMWWRTD